jgi:propionaldehyde dehydrogenase
LKLIARIEEIAYRCSGIRNLVVTVAEPTFEATQQMMAHPLIAVLAITGGPGIVAMGMKSGKKVIGAGAGNPPCIVDETADLVKAAEDIISGAAFDYNLPCIAEKSLIVVASVADRLIQQMQDFDALLLSRRRPIPCAPSACPTARRIKNWSVKARLRCWRRPVSPFRLALAC